MAEGAESEIQNAKSKIEEPRKQKSEAGSQESEAAGFGTGGSGLGKQAEKQKSEAKQGTGGGLQGAAAPDPKSRIPNCGAGIREQASIGNQQSTIRETRNPNPEPQVPDSGSGQSSIDNHQLAILDVQWKVERLIGVFLCSWTYPAFKAAEECNRRAEEAFRTLEGAVEAALARLDRIKREKGKKGKRGKGRRRNEPLSDRAMG